MAMILRCCDWTVEMRASFELLPRTGRQIMDGVRPLCIPSSKLLTKLLRC